MLVLLAEDQADLAELTIDFLDAEDIDCDYAADGQIAINLLGENDYDVIILDINMPRADGFSVCQWLKAQQINTPVLLLTARDTLDDKLKGFELGAQDYLTKPFELEELAARINVLASRNSKACRTFQLDDLQVDFTNQLVKRGDVHIPLPPAQWQLLEMLAKNSPKMVLKAEIETLIWPNQDATLAMYKSLISRLRNLIDKDGQMPLIKTIRGEGMALRKS